MKFPTIEEVKVIAQNEFANSLGKVNYPTEAMKDSIVISYRTGYISGYVLGLKYALEVIKQMPMIDDVVRNAALSNMEPQGRA